MWILDTVVYKNLNKIFYYTKYFTNNYFSNLAYKIKAIYAEFKNLKS